ncbi:carbohydrate kinase family protein [Nocardia puris]|uniref:Fructokinase n=1 Tax=Nocardia puris TaxID=208602 RepID=A0A366E6A1_9NOCA|nr:carbohydrate kinase [Nocardia puris]RBO96938.1 fructokinase [Nocardia puris]
MNGALVVGEALIDVVVRDGRIRDEHVGGSPLNVAVGLARLGRPVDFRTHLGPDLHGDDVVEYITASGVRLPPGRSAARTSTAIATLDENGSADYEFDLDWDLPVPSDLGDPRVIHTGSIASVLEPGCHAVAEMLRAGRTSATITYDPNVRPSIIADEDAARARIADLVALSDVVKVSDEDLHWFDPDRTPEEVARDWFASGPALVVVTMGGRGAFAVSGTGLVTVPAYPVDVIDTVGAGDAATAGLLDALWSADLLGAHRRPALADIDTTTVARILRTATLNSALTVARAGADLPDRATHDAAAARFAGLSG